MSDVVSNFRIRSWQKQFMMDSASSPQVFSYRNKGIDKKQGSSENKTVRFRLGEKMIDYTEIPYNSDLWELFARDFLQKLGFHIESPPDRGADGGKDMLVTEEIQGPVFKGRFRWLVSCKHYATSGKAVNETDDEPNILERMKSFKAGGFLGFYSTLASAGLNTRLRQLRENENIEQYRVFDHKLIENYLVPFLINKFQFC